MISIGSIYSIQISNVRVDEQTGVQANLSNKKIQILAISHGLVLQTQHIDNLKKVVQYHTMEVLMVQDLSFMIIQKQ